MRLRAITARRNARSARLLVGSADGFAIDDGTACVPDTPGCELAINAKAFDGGVKVLYDVS